MDCCEVDSEQVDVIHDTVRGDLMPVATILDFYRRQLTSVDPEMDATSHHTSYSDCLFFVAMLSLEDGMRELGVIFSGHREEDDGSEESCTTI